MVYAIAHVRGGQEMGRAWYDAGHLLNKKNTFTDFIDVTRYLVANGYAAKDRVAASGGSAGGLLMGAVANMAPQDYRVIITQVPFVDAVTTMLDASIPLTTNEYDEWGNPAEQAILRLHAVLLALRQCQRARPIRRCSSAPACGTARSNITSRPNGSRKLRAMKTDNNPLVFRINMEAGHGGKSGRFEQYRSRAEYYAFMLCSWVLPSRPAEAPAPATPPRRGRTGLRPSASIGATTASAWRVEQAGEHHRSARRERFGEARRELDQRTGENVGDDQVERRAGREQRRIHPVGDRQQQLARAVAEAHALIAALSRATSIADRVDVGRDAACARATRPAPRRRANRCRSRHRQCFRSHNHCVRADPALRGSPR